MSKTITPRMVQDWLTDVEDVSYIFADIANGKLTPSELKEDISIYIDNERSSR